MHVTQREKPQREKEATRERTNVISCQKFSKVSVPVYLLYKATRKDVFEKLCLRALEGRVTLADRYDLEGRVDVFGLYGHGHDGDTWCVCVCVCVRFR